VALWGGMECDGLKMLDVAIAYLLVTMATGSDSGAQKYLITVPGNAERLAGRVGSHRCTISGHVGFHISTIACSTLVPLQQSRRIVST
jgi:hypothetical protein